MIVLGYTTFALKVTNVAPTISPWGIFNSLNQQLGVDVPFFLQRLPVTDRASFTDPGKPDTQTAAIQWGDGTTDSSNVFEAFSDAFGGVVGQLRQSHRTRTRVPTVSLSWSPIRIRMRTPSRHKSRS